MSEEMGISVVIGGEISRDNWQKFAAKFDAANPADDYGINPEGRLYTVGSADFGNTDDLQAACEEFGLAYSASSDAKYEYDGDTTVWFPDMEASQTRLSTQDGDPAVTLKSLKEEHEKGRTLAELIEVFEPFFRPIPPLTIGGVQAVDADLDDQADPEEEDEE